MSVSFPPREGIASSRSVGQRAVNLQQHGRLTSRHTVATLHQVDQSYFVETREFARRSRRHLDLVSSHAFSTIILHPPFSINPCECEDLGKCVSSRAVLRDLIVRRRHERTPLACLDSCDGVRWHWRSIEPMSDRYVSISLLWDSRSIIYLSFVCSLKFDKFYTKILYSILISCYLKILWRFIRVNVTFRLWL